MGSNYRRQRTEFSKEEAIHDEATSVSFGVYSADEIRKLSVVQVVNPLSFNQLGHPVPGGLYDLHMGPFSDRGELMCSTCMLHCEHCPGHLGHIELPLPVCNPLFYNTILRLLKMSCVTCHRFRIDDHLKRLYLVQQELLDHGLVIQAQEAQDILTNQSGGFSYDEDEKAAKKAAKQSVDSAMIIAKLDKFKREALADSNVEVIKNTRSIEALRKSYNKEFLSQSSKSSCCPNCGAVTKTIVFYKSRFIYEGFKLNNNGDEVNDSTLNISQNARKLRKAGDREKTELNPEELQNHFRELFAVDPEIMTILYPMLNNKSGKHPTDLFFVNVLSVPPPKTRPCQFTGGMMTIHPQSTGLQSVVETVTILKQILQVVQGADVEQLPNEAREMLKSIRGETSLMQMDTVWKELQQHVDHVLDRDMNRGASGKGNTWGFKQVIERKQGLFRMNMMGKRVNFAARTVITPDPNLCIDEIGLPEVFAKKLTYRTPVTHWNVEELRQAVINGPDVHPGALFVESESGYRTMINPKNLGQREALAKTLLTPGSSEESGVKYVHRHLKNGDAMLLNRQPTLHKPSIMAHRARVLKGHKVMRLHYAICKSYNADFDGDEMNAHYPQNEVARSEAYNIVNVCKQYLVPKDGSPLQGLIQDHIIAGVKMTIRGRFFPQAEYQQLVFGALVDAVRGKIKTLPPCILKPYPLWSGKQIISTIIINLVPKDKDPPTLMTKAKIKGHEWEKHKPRKWRAGGSALPVKMEVGPTMCESEVIFSKGEFLSGILDKNQYGATHYSLVHAFFELYGGTYSGKLLSAFSKIFTNFLHTEGFTLGVRDILVTDSANEARKAIMKETRKTGLESAADGVGLFKDGQVPEEDELDSALENAHRESRKVPKRRMDIDRAYKERLSNATNKINSACMPRGLVATFPQNNLQLMVQAGAKGSSVNTMQISCLLGQIELEGKRPPLMVSGKPLPSFKAYDKRPRAGGFIDGRFMTGIKPQEFFYHCMAGREGLIDTAVKTSRSGYLQRCLIKLLEGLVVNYDQTVRDSCDGSVIQFQYGEDGLDVCKSQYLKSSQLDFLNNNKAIVHDPRAIQMAKAAVQDPQGLDDYKETVRKAKAKNTNPGSRRRVTGFVKFCEKYGTEEVHGDDVIDPKNGRTQKALRLEQSWRRYANKHKYEKKVGKMPDPLTSKYRPDSNFGSVSETIDKMIEDYQGVKDTSFREMLYTKFMHAMVDAGEPVGVLAAQSVGEPSTQMTLNTFHFAGRGDMNVTLGIPRLREILMVASANIKTPSLTIPFLPHVTDKEKEALRVGLNRVTLANLLECVHVHEKLNLTKGQRSRLVTMRFEFLPRKSYKAQFAVNPATILNYMEKTFISKKLLVVLAAVIKDKKINIETENGKGKRKRGQNEEDEEDDSNEAAQDKTMDQIEKGGFGEGHASSDEEELADDADATDARKKSRQMDQDFAEELSDEEVDLVRNLDKELGDDPEDFDLESNPKSRPSSAMDKDEGIEEMEEDEDMNDFISPDKKRKEEKRNMQSRAAQIRKIAVLNLCSAKGGHASIVDYLYDTEKELWCEMTMAFRVNQKNVDMSNVIRKAAEKAVIRETKNISRAFLIKNDKNEVVLTTEGANIEAMFKYENILDLRRLHCNNVHDMARYYGIEAANKTIVHEIVNVFSAYGIEVNPRHLSLIADYMTFDGTYKPFNRIGIENNPSPFQQMTFETAIGFLRSATLAGKSDTLDSPSSCIVIGKPFCGGTGSFKVMQDLLMSSVKEQNF